uniref:Uncharacterized protein n=1 Tax=Branchiostoma floridae TaxID=7739 RepID=C3Y4Q7_BRAFL|eukprot:XP_002608704.1 hypothetical protein BRAFLDRAFT_73925 [Branchiostoma floridae]
MSSRCPLGAVVTAGPVATPPTHPAPSQSIGAADKAITTHSVTYLLHIHMAIKTVEVYSSTYPRAYLAEDSTFLRYNVITFIRRYSSHNKRIDEDTWVIHGRNIEG